MADEPARKPKFSKDLLDLRHTEVTLAKQGMYADAQKVKVRADAMEAAPRPAAQSVPPPSTKAAAEAARRAARREITSPRATAGAAKLRPASRWEALIEAEMQKELPPLHLAAAGG